MKNKELTIGIVTFRQRADMVRQLIGKIRERVPENVNIILVINNNNNVEMPDYYRKNMLQLSVMHKNIYPIFCPQMMSLSKLWNTIVIFSKTEYNLILGDDVEFGGDVSQIYESILNHIDQTGQEFFTINYGFSHFVCSKNMLDKLNYFDERLCALGHEDAEMHIKHIEQTGSKIPTLIIPPLFNKAAYQHKSENMETWTDNKPKINMEIFSKLFNYTDEKDPNGIVLPMTPNDKPLKRILDSPKQYPHEMFVNNNRHNIEKFTEVVF